jgi:hypothetical protein
MNQDESRDQEIIKQALDTLRRVESEDPDFVAALRDALRPHFKLVFDELKKTRTE